MGHRRILIATTVAAVALMAPVPLNAFAPPASHSSFVSSRFIGAGVSSANTPAWTSQNLQQRKMMMDPSSMAESANALVHTTTATTAMEASDLFLSFADQGQNLAGIFFQASLLPYLIFLYFLSFKGNRIPALGNFGWQFLLILPSGIITKATYGCTLADCDWLHGGAEALLTVTNVLIVLGFRDAMNGTKNFEAFKPRLVAGGIAALFFTALAVGPGMGIGAHSPFLFGVGNLSEGATLALPWVMHSEPINALSIPTWAIHFSSVYEFLFAMAIIWQFAETTDNPKWKGLTWGMLPLHASGIAACTYHFFYNSSSLQFLVEMQAGLTLLGNITVAIAAYRIAKSNGWTLSDLNPLPKSNTSPTGLVTENIAAMPLTITESKESDLALVGKLLALTIVSSYFIKYGELALDLPFNPNGVAAAAIVVGIPLITAATYAKKSSEEGGEPLTIPGFGGGEGGENKGLSMQDVKKYGVAGTVAYVLTELAFWAVAFPVASTALYQSTGHWPDVINDGTDRATVLGFIFAGANIARLLVPLRLGAALALAPWVDENILNRETAE
eukprot:CAMPEP_0185742088 /NCGR_PEP_ID=MMETSP1171-20130828/39297_1 /TAXON_ID=374046 /ORGANISM="Helicotheca tamensis, Strain CCMP826" /LENGTH=558 /DNA_ID=CAMNT_0028414087 /DNA_START=58 /DNA_END=1735 /DNA_ORIENTATION=-